MWGIGKPRREVRGEIVDSYEDKTDKVLVKIEKNGRNVSLRIYDRVDGAKLFSCEYKTNQSDRVVHYDMQAIANVFLKSHGLAVDRELTNIELPIFRTTNKRSR